MASVNHGATDVGSWEVNATDVFSVEGEPVEFVTNAFGADEERFGSTHIDCHAVGLHEAAGVCRLSAASTEAVDELS